MLDYENHCSQLGNEFKCGMESGVVHIWEATWVWTERKTSAVTERTEP